MLGFFVDQFYLFPLNHKDVTDLRSLERLLPDELSDGDGVHPGQLQPTAPGNQHQRPLLTHLEGIRNHAQFSSDWLNFALVFLFGF